ncbi:MAG: aminomethyl-transferring glycine dehydrogenase subunit GcvPA [Lachnospiraceae bacterium]|nr:aminomethyl-transferring glycine dehydrogenase subunit GcvPA [Lachnospiraceae bacterium]
MGIYVPNTPEEQLAMLHACGFSDFDELFSGIPDGLRLDKALNIPEGSSELEVRRAVEALAGKNHVYRTVLRGAGSYRHYIPAIVSEIVSKEEFRTAYTPYQAEISQGVLQSIFEFQTEICELTGMAAANASVYDGATAAAEAAQMCRERKRTQVLVSATVDPKILSVIRTYASGTGSEILTVPEKDGVTDEEALRGMLGEGSACFILQQPNFFGNFEEADRLGEITHAAGAKFVMSVNPIALALMKTPGECSADVAVGEGEPLGLPMGFGGPYLGFMAADEKMMRKLPGRIVGETEDLDGKRCYVLTLQAREQHIRREKAGSNICSNEALCALTAAVYLAAMGPQGLRQAAESSMAKAHYLKERLAEAGLKPAYERPFFHEFVTECGDEETAVKIEKALAREDILGGLRLGNGRVLWCATEMNTREELDKAVSIVREVCAS